MAERREDVEELLRLKTNPFPDGTLEAPEFPRRVYASNVVQPVNAQLVAQSKSGPKLLQADDTGVMQVAIPDASRPSRSVLDFINWQGIIINAGNYIYQSTPPPSRCILSIRSINLNIDLPSGATQGSVDFYIKSSTNSQPLLIVSWPYNVKPVIQASLPMGTGIGIWPGPTDAWVNLMLGLRFDSNCVPVYYLYNNTNGLVSSSGALVNSLFFLEYY
jgi:hypothetical protein